MSESELRIETREQAGTVVIQVSGEVNLRSSPQLLTALRELAERGPRRLVIDLHGVSYMDSSGLGSLVDVKRRLERRGGRLTLAALQPRVRSVLEIAQLHRFFTIAASVAEAESDEPAV